MSDTPNIIGHFCSGLENAQKSSSPSDYNGNSIELVYLSVGGWVATQLHYEYGTIINFCPFCGANLAASIPTLKFLSGTSESKKDDI